MIGSGDNSIPWERGVPIFLGWRRIKKMNQLKRTIPFKTEVIEMLHQTPDIPSRNGCDKNRASGIRAAVSDMPTIEGGYVLPIPLNAPPVVISMHMKNCEIPNILRYSIPKAIASGSVRNTEKIVLPKNIKQKVTNIPIVPLIPMVIQKPLKIRVQFPAPKF